uniref:Uncharacterized protein n=1 Tax=Glossina pallidipes TaxID=7398 RepID=A0A1A9ZSB2_GLOPL
MHLVKSIKNLTLVKQKNLRLKLTVSDRVTRRDLEFEFPILISTDRNTGAVQVYSSYCQGSKILYAAETEVGSTEKPKKHNDNVIKRTMTVAVAVTVAVGVIQSLYDAMVGIN